MFYPELLETFNKDILSIELVEEIDIWLGTLPENISSSITVGRFSKKFGIDFDLSRSILEKLCLIKILKRIFAIKCPECNHVIKITDEDNLVKDMTNIDFCYACENEEILIEPQNIEVRYKLIKKPNNPEQMKNICKEILGEDYKGEQNTILDIIDKCNYNVNKVFFKPTEEDHKELEELLCGVNKKYEKTTDQGNALEFLARRLLNLIEGITAIDLHTRTNQIDAFAINKCPLPGTTLGRLGNVLYCECKNEAQKPDNTYFHKLNSQIQLTKRTDDVRVGIVFSRISPTAPCYEIARKTYLANKIYLINFDLDEIEDIIINRKNFLDYMQFKLDVLEHDLKENEELKSVYIN